MCITKEKNNCGKTEALLTFSASNTWTNNNIDSLMPIGGQQSHISYPHIHKILSVQVHGILFVHLPGKQIIYRHRAWYNMTLLLNSALL